MTLFESWKRIAFDTKGQSVKHVWDEYLAAEKKAYKMILSAKLTNIEGTLAEIGARFGLSNTHMAAFIDGIHEAVDNLPEVNDLQPDTPLALVIDFERLYKKMVEFKAKDLFNLPEWDEIFSPEQQKELYQAQKKSTTVIRSEKIGRNDPCPCDSGKKYKKCCALNEGAVEKQ